MRPSVTAACTPGCRVMQGLLFPEHEGGCLPVPITQCRRRRPLGAKLVMWNSSLVRAIYTARARSWSPVNRLTMILRRSSGVTMAAAVWYFSAVSAETRPCAYFCDARARPIPRMQDYARARTQHGDAEAAVQRGPAALAQQRRGRRADAPQARVHRQPQPQRVQRVRHLRTHVLTASGSVRTGQVPDPMRAARASPARLKSPSLSPVHYFAAWKAVRLSPEINVESVVNLDVRICQSFF